LPSLLRRPDRPTAILTDDGADVPGILLHAARLGVRVPQDLSLLAIAREAAAVGGVKVDTLVLPFNKMALRAVPMLFERIAGTVDHQPPCAMPYEYVPGMTCAPPCGR
jgi:LacI family transcriptional regulator